MKACTKRRVILSIAALLLAAAELAVLFTYFLPFPFPVRPLRYPAEQVTEILIIRERREQVQTQWQTATDVARVTEPADVDALCAAFREVPLREQLGHRTLELMVSMGAFYNVCVVLENGERLPFAFGAENLLLRQVSSPFSTEEYESVFYRCDYDALRKLCDPYFSKYPSESLSHEEIEVSRPSWYLLKEAEYEYGSFGGRQ
mgnify:CR=1 FL=1